MPLFLDDRHLKDVSSCVLQDALRVVYREGNEREMKQGIHPEYQEINVHCACGHTFQTRSTRKSDLSVEICSECHPFFTGKQKLVDTAGRVDRFNRRYGKKQPEAAAETVTATETATAEAAQ